MLLILPNSFTSDQCSFLIDLYEKNNHLAGEWRDTYPLLIEPRDDDKNIIDSSILKEIKSLLCGFFNNNYIRIMEIVKWPTNSFQGKHFDKPINSLASITYLNHNFEGGQTCVEGEKLYVNPKVGTTFFFEGQKYEHNVLPITNGIRYTLAVWYTKNPHYDPHGFHHQRGVFSA